MFNMASEILINKLCNMHGIPIGAWDIGLIPVSTMATQPGACKWANCYVTPEFLGIPNKEDKFRINYSHLCLLGGTQVGRIAT